MATTAPDECIHGLAPATCSTCLHGPLSDVARAEQRVSQCRSCGRDVIWGVNPSTGKRSPLDADQDPNGNITIVGTGQDGTPLLRYGRPGSGEYVSHFSTCPESEDWRRR